MITIYNVKKSSIEEGGKFLVELRGLSTDEKPTSLNNGAIENGSSFIEIDTGDVYLYDLDNREWDNITTPTDEQSDGQEGGE